MKVLMIAPEPFFQPRGTCFSVLYRLKVLASLGHQTDLVTYPLGEDVAIPGVRIFRIMKPPFVKKVKVGPSWNKLLLDFLVFAKSARMLRAQQYDVIHTHEEASFMAVPLAKAFGTRHLYDMHSSLPQQLANFRFCNYHPFPFLFRQLERLVIDTCDGVITICPELHDYVKQINSNRRQVLIENLGEAWESASAPKDETKLRQLKDTLRLDSRPVVLFTGTFERYQGLDLLLDSACLVSRQHPESLFVLVGGNAAQVESLSARSKEKGLNGQVIFTGTVPSSEVPYYIELAQVLVSPRIEGSNTPLKIYAYLNSGRPIVATNLTTHTQVLNPKVALLTDPRPETFARGIIRLLEDAELRQTMASQAKKLMEEKYSYRSFVSRTKEIYDGLGR